MINTIASYTFTIFIVIYILTDALSIRIFRNNWNNQTDLHPTALRFLNIVRNISIILSIIVSVFKIHIMYVDVQTVQVIVKATGLFLLALPALVCVLVFNDNIDRFLFKHNIQVSIEPLLITLFIYVILSETTIIL